MGELRIISYTQYNPLEIKQTDARVYTPCGNWQGKKYMSLPEEFLLRSGHESDLPAGNVWTSDVKALAYLLAQYPPDCSRLQLISPQAHEQPSSRVTQQS